jgi:putative endonuclease
MSNTLELPVLKTSHFRYAMTDVTTRSRIRAERKGRRAEWLACLLLMLKGYRLRAWRYQTPLGEIDLLMRRGSLLVVVEVKARRDANAALQAITPRNRQRIERALRYYLQAHPAYATHAIRFDAVLVTPRSLPRHIPDVWRPEKG